MTERKNAFDGLSRLGELDIRSPETSQNKEPEEKKKKFNHRIFENYATISKGITFKIKKYKSKKI